MDDQITVYKIIWPIPFSSLQVGTLIYPDGSYYQINGRRIPFMTPELINQYCEPVTIHKQIFNNGTYVACAIDTNYKLGTIIGFSEEDGTYLIKLCQGGKELWLTTFDFVLAEKYYFLSSKGIVQETWSLLKPEADSWRRLIGNYFKTKEACKEYRNKLIQGK